VQTQFATPLSLPRAQWGASRRRRDSGNLPCVASLPPRTPEDVPKAHLRTATRGLRAPWTPGQIELQRSDAASINASRGDRACGREYQPNLIHQRWVSCICIGFAPQHRACEHSRIGFRNERGFAAGCLCEHSGVGAVYQKEAAVPPPFYVNYSSSILCSAIIFCATFAGTSS